MLRLPALPRWTLRLTIALVTAVAAHAAPPPPAPLSPELVQKIAAYQPQKMADGTLLMDCARAIPALFGEQEKTGKGNDPNPQIPAAIVALAERLPAGGALHLGSYGGEFDLRKIKDGIVLSGGGRGSVRLGNGQKGISALFLGPTLVVDQGAEGMGSEPLTDLTALMCGHTTVRADLRHSAIICSVNGWASNAFTVDGKLDDCLFLWLSCNWTFADYNAHYKTPGTEWWKKNCQIHINGHGGGTGTRFYEWIETNYGNPGTGVWLENCKGMAIYHGATERGSSQGPGGYYLQNCEGVQLGLRRFFCGSRGGGQPGCPSHELTIEGGHDNVLHVISGFSNPYGESLVNSDPALQAWATSWDYETTGMDSAGLLKYCFTPGCGAPTGSDVAAAAKLADEQAAKWVEQRNKKSGLPNTPESVAWLQDLIKRGRDQWWPINATQETTFTYAGVDLTQPGAKLPAGKQLPPPPSIPATNAPTSFRPLYYTEAPEFGRELLAAGADPSGKALSDDAFAKVMYGLPAADVERLVKEVQAGSQEAYDQLYPADPAHMNEKNKRGDVVRVKRHQLQVPAGTYRLSKTLHFSAGNSSMLGAGPAKTVLQFEGDIIGIKQWDAGAMANFAVSGGRIGLAVTGADHHVNAGAFQKSYIPGQNYYNLTFRGQSFCGFMTGGDDPQVMGGAEFDQDKFVNLTFDHTGDYGIYMGNNMTDKWLCLNGEFVGQKKAGISIKFNNLIHGGLYNCRFRDIDGPGIDFMGGNPELAFRPYVVMVDQCDFTECGNATQPCVDYGAGELMSFTRVKITTKNKAVKCGYIGSAQHYEDVQIDVKLATPGSPAMILRAVRDGLTARANGHLLRNVTANGPVAWVNDANAQNEWYRKTWEHLKKPFNADGSLPLKWDANPAASTLAPPNGWVHPFLFYHCQFGTQTYGYALLNVDVDHNQVRQTLDLAAK